MRLEKRISRRNLVAAIAVLLTTFSSPAFLQAQSLADNAVYNSSGVPTGSKSFIDASAFTTSAGGPAGANDLCSVLNYIYSSSNVANPIPSTGAVIDARGIAVGSTNTCANINPWPTSGTVPPTTVLLPAGGIFISSMWQIPSGTRLIGQRRNTNISPSSFTGSYMIRMGPASPCSCPVTGCAPVVLEEITLQGAALPPYPNFNGIDNECSGPLSYVDHVVIDLAGIGINIGPGAAGSGPYSNLNYIASTYCESNQPCPSRCVVLKAPTRGVHGMTCTMASTTTSTNKKDAAILLDGTNNSIEDVHFEGFYNGVLVGDTASAAGSTLLNLTSGTGAGPVVNTVHICNPASPATGTSCTSYTNTTPGNITISQVINNTNNTTGTNAYTAHLILDDVTGTAIGVSPGSFTEYTAGLYALGDLVGGGYSRFSTTTTNTSSQATIPATPVWGIANLGSTTPAIPCPIGSIFSNPGGTSGSNDTIYVCEFNSAGTATQWTGVK